MLEMSYEADEFEEEGDDIDMLDGDEMELAENTEKNSEMQSQNQGTCDVVKNAINFTEMPKLLDASIEKYDKDSALRSTVIKTNNTWTRCRQINLLTKPKKSTLGSSDVQSEKNKAFDLLDALSRSGSLPIVYSDLHVVLCVTHRFEKDVMNTIIQDNINPIERPELSTLLLGSTVHGTTTLKELVVGEKTKTG